MSTITEQLKQELKALIKESTDILRQKLKFEAAKELHRRGKGEPPQEPDNTSRRYQQWYTKALPAIRQLLPERYDEFREFYRLERRKEINALTYTISDYLASVSVTKPLGDEAFSHYSVFVSKFQQQTEILSSAFSRLDSLLADIGAVLQAELFDDELSVANELLKKSHFRAAGAVAGVVVERHLDQVASAHSVTIRKAKPTISDLNDALKAAEVYDVPDWRFIQRLGDIRNLCVHSKDREPIRDEVNDLITGADKIVKTIF